jgi:adenine-specific DNA-methyltransferase
MRSVITEQDLAGLALALGAERVHGWSEPEAGIAAKAATVPGIVVDAARRQIERGRDPLGTALCAIRSPEERRPRGATYTPPLIVNAMLRWAAATKRPIARIVDPGVGSARFLVAAGRRFPNASLIGIELDPLAALIARGHIAAAKLETRSEIVVGDFREFACAKSAGSTLWIGNPPYVRHHLIEPAWKDWLARTARRRGFEASQLAGLHVHFFLATVCQAEPGDIGALITAAEWLDVNYGHLVRELFLGPLGGRAITLIDPTARPFPDAASTAAISCFDVGTAPTSIRLRRVETLDELGTLTEGRPVRRERLETATRWTPLTRPQRKTPQGFVELGELCRVHRGQVTGANKVWIAGLHSRDLPASVLYASITRARELFDAHGLLSDASPLRRVIDLPADLDTLDGDDRHAVEAFIKKARRLGADKGYIAQNRKVWWSVGLREPAPILATYMARRPPAFVRNKVDARHINIAHGIYPRERLSDTALAALAAHLARTVAVESGRTYAGGLTKFEPREMERLPVPDLPMLSAGLAQPE